MLTSKILEDVRMALDENRVSTTLVDSDTLSMNDIIVSKMVQAVKNVEMSVPVHMLEGVYFSASINWKMVEGIGAGSLFLPSDFMRLVSFKMSDWSYAVSSVILGDTEDYRKQISRYPGVRGCPQRPVCALVNSSTGLTLEFFSCTAGTGTGIEKALYVAEPVISGGDIVVSPKCYNAIIYTCAGLSCSAYGAKEQSEMMFKIAKDFIDGVSE